MFRVFHEWIGYSALSIYIPSLKPVKFFLAENVHKKIHHGEVMSDDTVSTWALRM